LAVSLQYRANQAIWILSLVTEPLVYMAVWTNIARQQNGDVGGYSAGEFAAYYLVWMLVRHLAVTLSPDAIEWRVRSGEFSMLMLRPIHPIHGDLGDNFGYKLVALPIVLLMMLGLSIIFPPTFNFQLWSILAFIPVMFLAFLIRFLSHWILGLIAFWLTRARAVFEVFYVLEIFLTGRLAPLSLLPPTLMIIASISPFRWMVAFPVELLLGKLKQEDLVFGLGAQTIWLGIEILLLILVWRAAIRRYTAVGA